MELRFGGSGANGPHTEHVGQKLGGNGIQHLARDWHALVRKVDEQLPRHAQALVDLERIVDVRIVDQTFPAHGGAGLFQVSAHDDKQVILILFLQLQQPIAVFQGSLGVVNRTGTNDDHQPALSIAAVYNICGFIAGLHGSLLGSGRLGDFVLKQIGGRERVVAPDAPVFGILGVADRLVLNVELQMVRPGER